MQLVLTDPSRLRSLLNHSPCVSTTNKVAQVLLLLLMDKKRVSAPCVKGEDKNHIKTARVQDFKRAMPILSTVNPRGMFSYGNIYIP